MATITATITIDFTANYAGSHRVCYRIQGSGDPYDCTTLVNCVGGGTTCQAIILADVNDTSCDGDVIFEGYIQSACEDILSVAGRLAWTATFTPIVTCQRTEFLCARVPLLLGGVAIAGTGYTLADTITVVRDPADTETLDAIITLDTVGGLGEITGVTLTNPGLYTIQPTIAITTVAGVGAVLDIILGPCPTFDGIGADCVSADIISISNLAINQTLATCLNGGVTGVIPVEYEVTTIGCCIPGDTITDPCTTYNIDNQYFLDQTIVLTLCGGDYTTLLVPTGTSVNVCAILGSIQDPQLAGLTIIDTGIVCT